MLDLKTIDISQDDQDTATRVVDAARNLGFIYVANHDVPRSLIRQVFALSTKLFKLDAELKEMYKIGPENRGWSRMGTEILDPTTQKNADYKEAFNIDASSGQNLPDVLSSERALLQAFEAHCQRLCQRMCKLLATGLGLNEDHFSSRHNVSRPSGTMMRLLFYPAAGSTTMLKDEVRAGAHTDYGSLTLLFQNPGQSGLEVLDPSTNSFQPVPAPSPDSDEDELPILVNVADQLTLWTAGDLKSTVHRVTGSYTGDRYSIAYFCHPDDDTELKASSASDPHCTSVTSDCITAGEHLRRRLAATYQY